MFSWPGLSCAAVAYLGMGLKSLGVLEAVAIMAMANQFHGSHPPEKHDSLCHDAYNVCLSFCYMQSFKYQCRNFNMVILCKFKPLSLNKILLWHFLDSLWQTQTLEWSTFLFLGTSLWHLIHIVSIMACWRSQPHFPELKCRAPGGRLVKKKMTCLVVSPVTLCIGWRHGEDSQ